ncbi:MAG: phosphate/phosphite/phosphonate ABC transporter substrate-binding protein [Bacillota bacterium]
MTARLLALLTLLLMLSGCSAALPSPTAVDLSQTKLLPTAPAEQSGQPLNVAIAAVISPKETLVSYRELLDYLGARLGRPIRLVQRSTYAEVNELVRTGEVDLAFICTWAYVDGKANFGMKLLAAPQVEEQAIYYSYLLVPANSPANSMADLRDGVFAFTDPLSTTGRLVPVYWVWQEGEKPADFFRKQFFTYSHDRAVLAVADGLVDGAAVDHLVYDAMVLRDPSLKEKVRVIQKSEPIGTPPVVVGPGLDEATRRQLEKLFLELHETPEGAAILKALRIDRFVIPPDSAYDPIRRMLEKVGRP